MGTTQSIPADETLQVVFPQPKLGYRTNVMKCYVEPGKKGNKFESHQELVLYFSF